MRGWHNGTATRHCGARLFLSGLAALAAGVLVYALERPADSVPFLPTALSLHDGHARLPPALGGALPTFAHTVAFALMTVALLGPGTHRAAQAAVGWAAVNILFELAQLPLFAATLDIGMPGVFDPLDLLAAPLGGLAAVLLAWKLQPQWRTIP